MHFRIVMQPSQVNFILVIEKLFLRVPKVKQKLFVVESVKIHFHP